MKRQSRSSRSQDAIACSKLDLVRPYVEDLRQCDRLRSHSLRRVFEIGVDPLGGAAVAYWQPIQEMYGIDLTVVNDRVDPQFSFMTVGSRSEDPHGLLQSLCDGQSGQAEG